MLLETHMKLCMTEADFVKKKKKIPKKFWKMGQKIGFFEFIERFGH